MPPHPPPSSRENKAVDEIKCSLMRCDIMQYAQRMHFHKGENFITGPSANRINTLEERERYDATTGATLKGPSGLSRSWTNCLSGIRFHGEIQNTSELGICCSKVYGLFSESQTHSSSSSSTDSKFYSFITVYVCCRHLGLLTRGCWGCSNFPSRKCKLRRCSRFIFQTRTRKFQLHIHSGTHYYCAFYVTENI